MSHVGTAEAKAPAQESVVAEETKVSAETKDDAAQAAETEAEEGDETGTEAEGSEEGAEKEAAEEAGDKKPTKSAIRREKQKAREAELVAENKRLAERLAAVERNKPGDTKSEPRPDRSKYEDEAEYISDLSVWKAREAARSERTKNYETDSSAARADAAAARMTLFKERAMALTDRFPDIEAKVFNDPTLPMSATMAQTIMDSEKGPEIAYHLSANRELAQRIKSMEPLAAAREIGRIEATLSLPKTRTETQAPPPPKTLKGSVSGPTKKLADMSMAEYAAHRAKGGN